MPQRGLLEAKERAARGREARGEIGMRLYWLPGTAAMAPHAALAEIGVDYELVLVERDEAGNSPPSTSP
jgi:hypothetical protein